MHIGWIGLGNMGSVMAARVLAAGHTVTVYNRTKDRAAPLLARGARLADTPAQAADNEVLVTMVADDRALQNVLNEGGALGALPGGAVHVSMSTISVALATELEQSHAARGVGFVGAPVFGRPDAAAAGKLFVLAAGAATELEKCRDLFQILSQKVLPLGPKPATAHLTKVLGNFLLISNVELLGEALNVAQRQGADPQVLLEALTGSVFSAPFFANYGRMIVAQQFKGPAAFALPLAKKDVELARSAALATGAPLPMADTVHQKLERLVAEGGTELDVTVLGKWT